VTIYPDFNVTPLLDYLSLRSKTQTKRLKFGLSPELRLTNRRAVQSHWPLANVISLMLPYFFVYFWISEKWSDFDFRSSKLNLWL